MYTRGCELSFSDVYLTGCIHSPDIFAFTNTVGCTAVYYLFFALAITICAYTPGKGVINCTCAYIGIPVGKFNETPGGAGRNTQLLSGSTFNLRGVEPS